MFIYFQLQNQLFLVDLRANMFKRVKGQVYVVLRQEIQRRLLHGILMGNPSVSEVT